MGERFELDIDFNTKDFVAGGTWVARVFKDGVHITGGSSTISRAKATKMAIDRMFKHEEYPHFTTEINHAQHIKTIMQKIRGGKSNVA